MQATDFDTYTAAQRLREAGFDEDRAAAVAMVRDATGTGRDQTATKADLAAAIAGLENRMLKFGDRARLRERNLDRRASRATLTPSRTPPKVTPGAAPLRDIGYCRLEKPHNREALPGDGFTRRSEAHHRRPAGVTKRTKAA